MEFGLGWGNLKMGMGSGGANRSPRYLLRQNLASSSGMDRDLMGIPAAAFLPVHLHLINLGVVVSLWIFNWCGSVTVN